MSDPSGLALIFLQDALQNFGKLRGISARQTPGVQVGTIRNEFILALQVHVEEVSEHHQTAFECLVAFLGRVHAWPCKQMHLG